MPSKLSVVQERQYDLCSIIEGVEKKDPWRAKAFIDDVLQRAITRWPQIAQGALSAKEVAAYKGEFSIRMKAGGARPLQMRAITLMEQLGDTMDDGSYAALMRPIVQQLEDAQRTLDQGVTSASQQAAAGAVATKGQISAPAPTDAEADRQLAAAVRTARAAGFSDIVNLAIARLARHIDAIPSVLGRKKGAKAAGWDAAMDSFGRDPNIWL